MTGKAIVPCGSEELHPLHHWYTKEMPVGSWHCCAGWPAGVEALVVGPNDGLVIHLPGRETREDVDAFMAQMTERFGDRVAIIVGAAQVSVLKGETSE